MLGTSWTACRQLILLALSLRSVSSGPVPEGGSCHLANVRIDPVTYKFMSDCDERTFCAALSNGSVSSTIVNSSPQATLAVLGKGNATIDLSTPDGVCTKRLCRKDEYPFGYLQNEPLPPMCSKSSFCPDEGSGCRQLLPVGSPCEMDRDYQCAPAPRSELLASSQNVNGSICLRSTC